MLELLIALIFALLTGASAGADAGVQSNEPVATSIASEPIVNRIWEDGSVIIDGQGYCLANGACRDGGTPTIRHEWAEKQLEANGWAMTDEELSAPIVLIDPVTCTTDALCIAANPHIAEPGAND